jgi:hypothetical protein
VSRSLVAALLAGALAAAGCANEAGVRSAGADAGRDPAPCLDTASDPDNCGACGRTCVVPGATAGCVEGECVVAACQAGRSDADGEVDNGCEVDGDCGAAEVGVHRANGDGHLYTTNLAAAQTAPFSLEARDYFRLHRDAGPGQVIANLCRKGDGKYFVTESATCENAGTVVEQLGAWATAEGCGAIPLYRLYRGGNGDHFYTVSAAERDSAVAGGYRFEKVAGHVWP